MTTLSRQPIVISLGARYKSHEILSTFSPSCYADADDVAFSWTQNIAIWRSFVVVRFSQLIESWYALDRVISPSHAMGISRYWFFWPLLLGYSIVSWYGSTFYKEASTRTIELTEQQPVLIRKVLEYLYTGDYTTESCDLEVCHQGLEDELLEIEREAWVAEDFRDATEKASTTAEHASHQVIAKEESPTTLLGAAIGVGSTSQDAVAAGSDLVTTQPPRMQTLHISCFHALVYFAADYFQIEGLKAEAKNHFRASFLKEASPESFTDTVAKVYSLTVGHDRGLRDIIMELVTDNLPALRKEEKPILDNDLLKRIPDFTHDLCVATLDKYVESRKILDHQFRPGKPVYTGFGSNGRSRGFGSVRWCLLAFRS